MLVSQREVTAFMERGGTKSAFVQLKKFSPLLLAVLALAAYLLLFQQPNSGCDRVVGSMAITVPKGFVRTGKDGSSYVLKDKDGKLVKQEVAAAPSTTPGTLSVTEGIGPEDYIAFPYGDRSKEGTLTTVVEDPWAENNGLKSLFGG